MLRTPLLNLALIPLCLLRVGDTSAGETVVEEAEEDNKIPYTSVRGPLSEHFQHWLQSNGYAEYDFALDGKMGTQASYGGREAEGQELKHRPVVFIHGNSDGALAQGAEEWAQGWSGSIEHFLANGYSAAELYATTYGDRDLANALHRAMDCATVVRLRRFVEAVLEYTGAQQVDIVAHSMGVTLARQLIHGHTFTEVVKAEDQGDKRGTAETLAKCFLGKPLVHRVHSLIGIAGANYGLCICADEQLARNFAACGKNTGFWTGSDCAGGDPQQCQSPHFAAKCGDSKGRYATMLQHLNREGRPREAKNIMSVWSRGDAVLGASNLAWGRLTSLIPHTDRTAVFERLTHYSLKWATVREQLAFLGGARKATVRDGGTADGHEH